MSLVPPLVPPTAYRYNVRMTEQQITTTLQDMTTLLASNLKERIEAAGGTRTIQIIQRQPCNMADLESSDLLVAKAADQIRSYLAAWPNVDGLRAALGAIGISHQDTIGRTSPMPLFNGYYASTPTSTGDLQAVLFWDSVILGNELAFALTCAVKP
jgi:hypothetical protein